MSSIVETRQTAREEAAMSVLAANRAAGRKVAVAESCTGGMVSAALTDIAGSSDVFSAGFITYSGDAKKRQLDVSGGRTSDARHDLSGDRRAVLEVPAFHRRDPTPADEIIVLRLEWVGDVEECLGLVHHLILRTGKKRRR